MATKHSSTGKRATRPAAGRGAAMLPVTASLLISAIILSSCGNQQTARANDLPPSRVVSFAPSITEILFELGLGGSVAGVTPFCKYPQAAALIENKVGGHTGRGYESALRLKPDLAVILKEHTDMAAFFDRYKIRYVAVGSDSVDDILESIRAVASACGVGERGDSLVSSLRGRMERARADGSGGRPKVLLCVDRENIGSGAVGKCFAAGAASFYDQLIEAAGGVNVLKDAQQAYPSISAETVIRFDPDVIIDISSAYADQIRPSDCEDWGAFKTVAAVKSGRVHCLSGGYLTVPGPRFVNILEDFSRVIARE